MNILYKTVVEHEMVFLSGVVSVALCIVIVHVLLGRYYMCLDLFPICSLLGEWYLV